MLDAKFWKGRRVLLTGHTGFKGGWTALWLSKLGAEVTGLALPPQGDPSFFQATGIADLLQDLRGDIADQKIVEDAFLAAEPEILLHMAAQPIVRRSYVDPVETYRTNVLGTAHVLEAARQCKTLRSIVVVTTDKCYENNEWEWAYREVDPLGGKDPYSSSKACAELVSSSFRQSYFCDQPGSNIPNPARLATVRAGNVIGGGDWTEDRLVPDIVRALIQNEPVNIRNPGATRPWQHVIEPVCGYLCVAEQVFRGNCDTAFNFGPNIENEVSVATLVDHLIMHFPTAKGRKQSFRDHPKEARFLRLDSSKAKADLGWRPVWGLADTLRITAEWFTRWLAAEDMRSVSLEQIAEYESAVSLNIKNLLKSDTL